MHEIDISPASDLGMEALNLVGNRLADMEEKHFSVFLLFIVNSWAENFISPELQPIFFDTIANNIRLLGEVPKQRGN